MNCSCLKSESLKKYSGGWRILHNKNFVINTAHLVLRLLNKLL
jgi:hypothetical protein